MSLLKHEKKSIIFSKIAAKITTNIAARININYSLENTKTSLACLPLWNQWIHLLILSWINKFYERWILLLLKENTHLEYNYFCFFIATMLDESGRNQKKEQKKIILVRGCHKEPSNKYNRKPFQCHSIHTSRRSGTSYIN